MQQQTSKVLAGCVEKVTFRNPAIARRVIERRRRHRKGRSACAIYRCQACGGWHIGNRK